MKACNAVQLEFGYLEISNHLVIIIFVWIFSFGYTDFLKNYKVLINDRYFFELTCLFLQNKTTKKFYTEVVKYGMSNRCRLCYFVLS